MKNAQIMVEGNTLTIKVDLSKEFGRRRAWGGDNMRLPRDAPVLRNRQMTPDRVY